MDTEACILLSNSRKYKSLLTSCEKRMQQCSRKE